MDEMSEDLLKKQDLCMIQLYHLLQCLLIFKRENDASEIYHVVENWVRFYYKNHIQCGMCADKGLAVGYCRDCEKPGFIDGFCLKVHKKITTFERHRFIEFTKDGRNHRILDFAPQKICLNHINETELELYCNKCKIVFCEKCEGKEHDHNHKVHSQKNIYILLDNVHDTKRQIEEILQRQQNLSELEHKKLTTMIMWIDVALGIVKRYSNIKDVPIPPEINRLFENELSTNKSLVKYKEVIAKLAEIQGDLRLVFTSDAICEEDTIPKFARTNEDQHKRGGVINVTLGKSNVPHHTEFGVLNNVPDHRNNKLNQEDTSYNNDFLTCPKYMSCMPVSNEDLAGVLFTGTTNVIDTVTLSSSKDMFISLQEMGFEGYDVKKAYAVLKKSGRKDITVDMLLNEILETQEDPTDVSSLFASQQRRRDEEECKNEVEMLCKICSESIVTTAFLPCGHLAACVKCAPALKKCPICRTVILVS